MTSPDPPQIELLLFKMIENPAWEPGYEQYVEHMTALNAIIDGLGELVEGSLFFSHNQTPLTVRPLPLFLNKRRNFAVFSLLGHSLLEIGFNAGHSALLALTVNPALTVECVDIGIHRYTQPCFDYLQSVFGDRITLRTGDSREIVPLLLGEGRSYELFHIDGNHAPAVARKDLQNVLLFGREGGVLMVDDTHNAMIDALCEYFEARGDMTRIKLTRIWAQPDRWSHAMFRMHPRADRFQLP